MKTLPSKLFPFLKGISSKRKCVFRAVTTVYFSNVNWSGGSRSEYTAVDLRTGKTSSPNMGQPAPWDNPYEGLECPIPVGVAIVRHGTFCGKPTTPYVMLHPDTLKSPELLGQDVVRELTY